jgi:hypothetical protein
MAQTAKAFDARDYHEDPMSAPVSSLPDGPPTLKAGHYYGVVTRREKGQTPWNPETEAILYHCQLLEPAEDVSTEDLEGVDLRSMNLPPYALEIATNRMHAFKILFKSFPEFNQNLSTDQLVDEVIGKRVLLTVTSRPGKKRPGEPEDAAPRVFNNISFMVGAPR